MHPSSKGATRKRNLNNNKKRTTEILRDRLAKTAFLEI
jgi:hypothetical protein